MPWQSIDIVIVRTVNKIVAVVRNLSPIALAILSMYVAFLLFALQSNDQAQTTQRRYERYAAALQKEMQENNASINVAYIYFSTHERAVLHELYVSTTAYDAGANSGDVYLLADSKAIDEYYNAIRHLNKGLDKFYLSDTTYVDSWRTYIGQYLATISQMETDGLPEHIRVAEKPSFYSIWAILFWIVVTLAVILAEAVPSLRARPAVARRRAR